MPEPESSNPDAWSDDPFSWDAARVAQELCDTEHSSKLPPPSILSRIIIDNDVDGEVLMKCSEDVALAELMCKHLGLVKIKHMIYFLDFIKKLKSRSLIFQAGHQDFSTVRNSSRDVGQTWIPTELGASVRPQTIPNIDRPLETSTVDQESSVVNTEGRPRKKIKRAAVETIQSEPVHLQAPPEPMPVLPSYKRELATTAASNAALRPVATGDTPDSEDTFSMVAHHERSIHRVAQAIVQMRRQLQPRRRVGRMNPAKRDMHLVHSNDSYAGLVNVGEDDVVLPVLGDSSEDYSDETKQAMTRAKEEAKSARNKRNKAALSHDEVRHLMDIACQEYRDSWRETKLPFLERTAFRLWSRARYSKQRRGQPNRYDQITEQSRRKEKLEQRLNLLKDKMLEIPRVKAEDVKKQCWSLEPTICEIEEAAWKMNILMAVHPPTRPDRSIRAKVMPGPRRQPDTSESGEAVSSNDFVESDGDDQHHQVRRFSEPSLERPASNTVKRPPRELSDSKSRVVPPRTAGQMRAPMPRTTSTPARRPSFDLTGVEVIDLTADDPIPSASVAKVPPLCKPSSIDPVLWNDMDEKRRLLLSMMSNWNLAILKEMFQACSDAGCDKEALWTKNVEYILGDPNTLANVRTTPKYQLAVSWARFFDAFIRINEVKRRRFKSQDIVSRLTRRTCKANKKRWSNFVDLFRSLYLLLGPTVEVKNQPTDSSDSGPMEITEVRRRPVVRDKDAEKLRMHQARRRKDEQGLIQANRERLRSENVPLEARRLIINESKAMDDGYVYVNSIIATRIKDHQVEGVRFLWNQVVADRDNAQGCLLAHTMGLGKTMQAITLLVAISDAASSPDETVSRQVPKQLKESRTLVLCPPTLVMNWANELQMWDPLHRLGQHYSLTSNESMTGRIHAVTSWEKNGGVLVLGYPLLRAIFKDTPMSGTDAASLQSILIEKSNIVIADEAHTLKNTSSQISKVCSQFKTSRRIALTGSPLANNVLEYYSMIEWVAHNYLGPRSEFSALYAKPIQEGLYQDSGSVEKRRALKKLKVLTNLVADKVHRRTTAVLKDCLPAKREFVFYVPLTELQQDLYNFYVNHNREAIKSVVLSGGPVTASGAELLGLMNALGLICNHPKIYHSRLLTNLQNLPTKQPSIAARVVNVNSDVETSDRSLQVEDNPEPVIEDADQANVSPDFASTVLSNIPQDRLNDAQASWKVKILLKILRESREVGDKVLVFSQSVLTLDYLEGLLKREQIPSCRLDGKTPMAERQRNVNDFNASESAVAYIISTKAGGQGLNIYGANRVVIFDFLWNPADESQALGRAYRIGQTKPVTVYRLVASGTFEEKKLNYAVYKLQLFTRVVDKAKPIAAAPKLGLDLLNPVQLCTSEDASRFHKKDNVLDSILADADLQKGIVRIMPFESIYEEDVNEALNDQEQAEVEEELKLLKNRNNASALSLPESFPVATFQPTRPPVPPLTVSNISTQLPLALSSQVNSFGASTQSQMVQGPIQVDAVTFAQLRPEPNMQQQAALDASPLLPITANASTYNPAAMQISANVEINAAPSTSGATSAQDDSLPEFSRILISKYRSQQPDSWPAKVENEIKSLRETVAPLPLKAFFDTAEQVVLHCPGLCKEFFVDNDHPWSTMILGPGKLEEQQEYKQWRKSQYSTGTNTT